METYYSVIFTSLFDLALIVVLLQHHRRLGYPYLRLGGLALGFEMASQVLVYLGVFLTNYVAYVAAAGIAQMLFSLAILGSSGSGCSRSSQSRAS